jgi:hypothetical protein
MAEDKTKQKQIFLKKEILEKGYDSQKFTEFLSAKKQNGQDIDNWTMDELKIETSAFIKQSPKPDKLAAPVKPHDLDLSGDDQSLNTADSSKNRTRKESMSKAPVVSKIEQTVMNTLPNASGKVEANDPHNDSGSSGSDQGEVLKPIHDQSQQITQMIINQSEEEKANMNDFNYSTTPSHPTTLNILNGERKIKIRVTE